MKRRFLSIIGSFVCLAIIITPSYSMSSKPKSKLNVSVITWPGCGFGYLAKELVTFKSVYMVTI